jgi:hypothetical protein
MKFVNVTFAGKDELLPEQTMSLGVCFPSQISSTN